MTTLVHFEVDEQTRAKKEEHLKKLLELSEKSLGEIPQLEEPTYEQKRWVLRKLKAPSWTWRSYT
jgi:hypothetical protein